MSKINVLPKHLAELIAAGEVVERPASVVKELLENSIDAGATDITVEIKNGGISYIRLTDNGSGILRDDIRNAFVSHATSKIADKDDLNGIVTLGFRGEALASVASVARVEVLTKAEEEEVGTHYKIESGEEILLDDAGCPKGTTIIVRDLFYATPARMKFLKKDVTEANAVAAVVDRIALSHPDISFRFIREGKQVLITGGNGDLFTCIREVLGKDIAKDLIKADGDSGAVCVSGYISKPSASRPNRNMQFFFINDRLVKTATGSAALSEAYKNSVMVGKFPICVLNISINPALVDVNVHPAKTEVRFSDERPIFNAVYYACKNALADGDAPKTLIKRDENFRKAENASADQLYIKQNVTSNENNFWKHIDLRNSGDGSLNDRPVKEQKNSDRQYSDFKKSSEIVFDGHENKSPVSPVGVLGMPDDHGSDGITVDELKNNSAISNASMLKITHFSESEQSTPEAGSNNEKNENLSFPKETPNVEISDIDPSLQDEIVLVGEAFKTYIICEKGNKLIIIDKHAAHERIIYEKLKAESGKRTAQMLLVPVTVTLSKEEYSAVTDNLELINDSGFEIEDFGDGCVLVRECPMELDGDDIESAVVEIAGKLCEKSHSVSLEKLDWIYHSVACRAAIKAGNFTSRYEMECFAKQLLEMPNIRYCPHGRPVLVEMTKRELERNFGRV